MNLIARITPFKNIFLRLVIVCSFACVLSLILKAHNSDVAAIIVGGLLLGFSAALPQLCQPFMRKITGSDATAIILIWLAMHCLVILASYLVNIKTAQPKTSLANWSILPR